MWRIFFRISATLVVLHGVLTFGAAVAIFHVVSADSLAFAQHGFTFIFIAALNLVTWQAPRRPRWLGSAVHGCNVAFLAFNVLFAALKPEPPTITAAVLLGLLAISAVGMDVSVGNHSSSR